MPSYPIDIGPAFTVYCGDALDSLKTLPSESVHCCVTSPPYFALRNYGVDGQIGLEETPDAYIDRFVMVFREVRRLLRDDGCLWVSIGDSYASTSKGSGGPSEKQLSNAGSRFAQRRFVMADGVKPKDLLGIPWMLAFALRADGWYLRSDIIWQKTNPTPEPVKDRPTKSHEQIFLLSKSRKYLYNADAIKEPLASSTLKDKRLGVTGTGRPRYSSDRIAISHFLMDTKPSGRNKRTVWTIPPKNFKGSHFATFSPELPRTCILAGSSENGCILDPFSGSGTTGIVAVNNGRSFIGCELNPDYIDITKKRYESSVRRYTSLASRFEE